MDGAKPPKAKKVSQKRSMYKTEWIDDFSWMRDRNDPALLSYLEAENAYTDSALDPTKKLQEQLYQEMLKRIQLADCSVPIKVEDFFYYVRTEEDKQYGIYCRKEGSEAAQEKVVLDANVLAQDKKYFRLGAYAISPDHRFLAYSLDGDGSEQFALYVKDLQRGELLRDCITGISADVVWSVDNQTLFYTTLDSAMRPYRVYRHTLGAEVTEDCLVYEEKDEAFFVSLSRTKDHKFILIELNSKTTSEVWILPSDDPYAPLRVIAPRRSEVEYSIEHHQGRLLVLTNEDAKNFRLLERPLQESGTDVQKEVLPHRPGVKLEGLECFEDYWVVYERHQGIVDVRIIDVMSREQHVVTFPEDIHTVGSGQNPVFKTHSLRVGYTSLVQPHSVYDYDMKQRELTLRKQEKVVGGYDSKAYESKRLFATASDGTFVPISLVYRKDLFDRGRNPLFLYGYGSYGISIDPEFSSNRLSLLDRGFVYAIAHIRGGGDLGRDWYENGKLMNKMNTFTDFIACAEHLIKKRYTSQERLAIYGGSAGGLLMGAVTNFRPDLFHAVVAKVPFVDVINTMLDPSLPLTVTEYEEWGDPKQEAAFDYMRSYSPYDNLKEQDYPHMLITGGLNDPRVQYWEPTKWTAALRERNTGNSRILLKMYMGAGHSGPSGRFEYLREIAFDYAFLLDVMDLKDEA